MSFLALYVVYVAFVFKGPRGTVKSSNRDSEGIGDYGSDGSSGVTDEATVGARWM